MKKILHVVGARPNFMKAAPVVFAIRDQGVFEQLLVHTGQHYDEKMSEIFFRQLGMPEPDINLEVGSGSHAVMTAKIMIAFEQVVQAHRPDLVMVYGDVNSTIACALVAAKLGVKTAHVEAGLRSFDRSMPEELNRLLTDAITDVFFTTSPDANEHLLKAGAPEDAIHFVGNGMIDTLVRLLPKCHPPAQEVLDLRPNPDFALVTLHRPSNVDTPVLLEKIVSFLRLLSRRLQVVFPVHPRTRQRMADLNLDTRGVTLCDPLGYLEFLWLQKEARMVITDSGGVQEETTYLKVPCLTLRENTERPITVSQGSNRLVGSDFELLSELVNQILSGNWTRNEIPEKWDGNSAQRLSEILLKLSLDGVF